jgi:hypothetical protein
LIGAASADCCERSTAARGLVALIAAPPAPNEAIDCTISAVESDDGDSKLAAVGGEGVVDPATVAQKMLPPLPAPCKEKAPDKTTGVGSATASGCGLTRRTHHAIAEALHIELAHVAFSVCGFGLFPASQIAAHLF